MTNKLDNELIDNVNGVSGVVMNKPNWMLSSVCEAKRHSQCAADVWLAGKHWYCSCACHRSGRFDCRQHENKDIEK